MDDFPKFCKKMAVANAVTKAASFVNNDEYDAMLSVINEAMKVELKKDYGLDYATSPKERLQSYLQNRGNLSIGFTSIDESYSMVGKGDLIIFVAQSGGGKSLMLQNLSVIGWLEGKSVVYLTMELSQELCAMRMDAMLLDQPTKSILKNLDATEIAIKNKENNGLLNIKQFPAQVTTGVIRRYLDDYISATNRDIDVLVVDYLDLVSPMAKVGVGDTFNKDKHTSEELRNMANELGSVLITASQLNRTAQDAFDDLNHSHIAGGISKINTADMVLAIISDDTRRAQGIMELQALKVRNGAGVGRRVKLAYNEFSMRISDPNSVPTTQNNSSSNGNTTPATQSPQNANNYATGNKNLNSISEPLNDTEKAFNAIQNIINKDLPSYEPVDEETGYKVPNGMVSGLGMDRANRLRSLLRDDYEDE